MNGHFEGEKKAEVWGACCHPRQELFATCGGDKTLRVWKVDGLVGKTEQFPTDITACDWSSDGSFIVAGSRDAQVFFIDAS